jgi:hypothetical protein
MASTFHVALGCLVALLYWTCLGLLVARRLVPGLALAMAPAVGWAVHNAFALPVFLVLHFLPTAVVAVAAAVLVAIFVASRAIEWHPEWEPSSTMPAWLYLPALLLAVAPAAAILPKHDSGAVFLADPIFDHAKVAIVDDIVRFGLPAGNPFLADPGTPRLVYYYLWHFSAAQLAAVTGVSGWEADASLTWFSAAAVLVLMTGIAGRYGGRGAALIVGVLSATASARLPLWWLFGPDNVDAVIERASGFAGLLFQSAWVPQHLMAATCVVAAVVLMSQLAERVGALSVVTLAFLAAAAFGSSTWIGGIVFAAAAPAVALVLVISAEPTHRLPFLAALVAACVLTLALAMPFWLDQLAFAKMRGSAAPVVVQFYPVLGEWFSERLRAVFDPPAFWLVLLTIELPAVYVIGMIALVGFVGLLAPRQRVPKAEPQRMLAALAVLVLASLVVAWLLASALGENNDLGWRAILPGTIALTVFAAIGVSRWIAARAHISGGDIAITLAALGIVLFGVPGGVDLVRADLMGRRVPVPAALEFAAAPDLWAAVRRHAVGQDRVGNNPLDLAAMTSWPVNISWALLSQRRSCYAGRELALVYSTLPPKQREQIDAIFVRVFAGDGSSDDVRELATRYACRVVVLTANEARPQTDEVYRLARVV